MSYWLVLIVGQRDNEEAHLGHRVPVVQDADAPNTRAQRLVEWWAVVGELCVGVNQNVIGGGDDVGGVNPHNCDGDVGTLTPLLHANRLSHGAHQATEVSEHTFFGIPLCADLLTEGGGQRIVRGGENRKRRACEENI